jgi:hypothetical protein
MHDYFTGWPIRRSTSDCNLLDGLLIRAPREARSDYIAVRLFGGPKYARIEREPIMIDWINYNFGPF